MSYTNPMLVSEQEREKLQKISSASKILKSCDEKASGVHRLYSFWFGGSQG